MTSSTGLSFPITSLTKFIVVTSSSAALKSTDIVSFGNLLQLGLMCLVLMNSTTVLILLICSLAISGGLSKFETSVIF